uniref:Bestrophin homolog n=2 Tax=Phytophthora ramorum TaxID=164328 RepID=H3GLA2_PHYRM
MASVAMVVAVANHYHPFVVATRNSTAFTDSLTVFNTFLGLIVSFRLNSAFTQWRAGMVAVGSLSEVAREIVGSGCAYVSTTIKEELKERGVEDTNDEAIAEAAKRAGRTLDEEIELDKKRKQLGGARHKQQSIPRDVLEKCTFFTELRRLVFLYIAIVFHDCRGRDGIDKLKDSGVLTEAEYDELYACGSEHKKVVKDKESYRALVRRTPHKLRATITELWLKRLVQVATRRGHLTLPNANNLQIKIAQLPNLYTTVFNIANVPIPFNYMQYLQYLLSAYMLLYTFVIVPNSGLYTPIWVFLWGTFLFMADEVAMEIECPFGLDANDIDLESRLLQIEEELTVLIRSQYYFITGGASLSHIPESSDDGSWRQVPYAKLQSKPEITEAFSFHQGRLSPSNMAMVQQDSLPQINEFTALIEDPAAKKKTQSAKGGEYGSTDAVA